MEAAPNHLDRNLTLGEQLLAERVISESHLHKALARQKVHGGRLGHNLVALGYVTPEKLNTFLRRHPVSPKNVEQTGLDISNIADLVLKHILYMGDFRLSDVVESTKLPGTVVDAAIEKLRREKLVEVKGAAQYVKAAFAFSINEYGKNRAAELLDICHYTGPAPVSLESYKTFVEMQSVRNIVVTEDQVKRAFAHMTLDEQLLRRIGPAISSGRPMFIYGPSGNGKTTIAETIGRVLPDTIFIPYALTVGGQIITLFDPVNHELADTGSAPPDLDRRWVQIKRPVIITGGELTLKMLDLEFNSIAKFYEAPLQMKANNGLFIIDDFGRQQMATQSLLNRWIVNLDRNIDYLSLHTGMKFDIPFNQLVIFSTNLEPKQLVDEAFLRRIRYKIKIDHPSELEYGRIFRSVCETNGIRFAPHILEYLLRHHYRRMAVMLSACHPRDIIDHIVDDARYHNRDPELTEESIDMAWQNYFVEM
ncbi:MAG: ATPase [Desulfuromonas sp.]|uniref:ATPase n=1 Tax=Desulfuromonas sp. TaxID=892 RepID=UPI000CC042EC|nr:ATPase [Desulfuromonas sp.]PLX85621.1 MAG: ATPase [Desulfuromonas sp.]